MTVKALRLVGVAEFAARRRSRDRLTVKALRRCTVIAGVAIYLEVPGSHGRQGIAKPCPRSASSGRKA
jgi:hypothetical protein